jgi:hypothetical protein
VPDFLETNVICYSTPLSNHLSLAVHEGGRERGQEIFRTLLRFIRPSVLIVHGADAARELAKVLGTVLPEPPSVASQIKSKETDQGTVFVLPSLAPPAYNKWSRWAPTYLDRFALAVARTLNELEVRKLG